MTTQAENALALIFPKGIFEWFDIVSSDTNEEDIHITFQEKNLPPISEHTVRKRIEPKGFTDITITDFPIRGRRSLLTFRRRYWQIEGEEAYLKRDIPLVFPGTQLETEFAHFLKEDGRIAASLPSFYRRFATPPCQRI